jgi:hypothetical protein
MKLSSNHKVKQQRRVVLLALYLLKNHCGRPNPDKHMVLRFIRSQHLMHIPVDDELPRSTGDKVWENDLAWKREDLKESGLVRKPAHGIWQITEHGERDVEAWAARVEAFTRTKPDWKADLSAHLQAGAESDDDFHPEYYITEETVNWGLKIVARSLNQPAQTVPN